MPRRAAGPSRRSPRRRSRQAALTHALTAADAGDDPVGGLVEYGELLGAVLDPAEYPALTEAVWQNAFGAAEGWIDDADFTFGLGLLLDGIETLIAAKSVT
ncbi:MAG: TetR/AcrR family transcriptional regulator C-terminal domain-containing protein [Actinoplanes sp.]